MWYYILVPIIFVVYIFELIYLYRIYNETKTDPFQQPLGFEEKKKFFNYTINYERYMNGFDYDCWVYQDLILETETKKLGDVFDIKTETIHYCSIFLFLLAFIFVSLIFIPLIIILLILCAVIFRPLLYIVLLFITCYIFINITLGTINLIIIIISIYSFNNSDINAYYYFLTCENINYDAFEKYRNIESLKTDFKHFINLFIINICFSCIFRLWDTYYNRSRN